MIYFNKPQVELTNWGPFICIDKFLSSFEISKLIAQMPDSKLVDAQIGETGSLVTSIRNNKGCDLAYNDKTSWVFNKLEGAINQVNSETYKFDLLGFHDAIQLLEYKPGGFYEWHMDNGNLNFSHRKLSIVIQLTDPSEYEGGDLEFFNNGTAAKGLGNLVLFPSYMFHRVLPVTSGLRRSLVAWISGQPYR